MVIQENKKCWLNADACFNYVLAASLEYERCFILYGSLKAHSDIFGLDIFLCPQFK